MYAGLWIGKAAMVFAVKLGSFVESQAKTDYNNFQTLCLCKAKKHFAFMVVIKALETQFNLVFQHQFFGGHKMKQSKGGEKRKGIKQTPLESQTFYNYLDTAGLPFWAVHEYGFWEVALKSPERTSKYGSEISYQHHNEQTQGHS